MVIQRGRTKGYRHHPQLARFRDRPSPAASIAEYLRAVHAEPLERGYRFDAGRIGPNRVPGRVRDAIDVPRGQIAFEWNHLRKKLAARAPEWRAPETAAASVLAHPLFRVVDGGIADWERPPL